MHKQICLSASVALLLTLNVAQASENSLGTWPIGVNTVLNGMIIAPDTTQFYNYTLFYSSDKLTNTQGDRAIDQFSSDTWVDAVRIDRGWQGNFLGFGLSSGIIITGASISADILGQHDSTTRLGDLTLKPIMLGKHNQDQTFFHYFSPLDVSLPIGSYSKDQLVNAGVNYYSYMPNYGFTWFPNKNIEVSGTLSMVFNTENKDTHYKSGSFFHYESSLGYSINEKLQLGLQGFYLKQLTDDKLNNTTYLDGYRGQAAGIGPQMRYSFGVGKAIVLKYQNEFAVENRPDGDRFWLQFTFPL